MPNSDWEANAAKKIWGDLSDRRGFGLSGLDVDDPELYEEIQAIHTQLIHHEAIEGRRSGKEGE